MIKWPRNYKLSKLNNCPENEKSIVSTMPDSRHSNVLTGLPPKIREL